MSAVRDKLTQASDEARTPPEGVRRRDEPLLDASVTEVPGVGAKIAERFGRLGVTTIRDLLLHVPSRYRDLSRVEAIGRVRVGQEVTLVGTVSDVNLRRSKSGKPIVQVGLADATGRILCIFFNQPWLRNQFRVGTVLAFGGRVESWAGRAAIVAPEWEPIGTDSESRHTGGLVPIYPATDGLSQRMLRRYAGAALKFAHGLGDPLPPAIRVAEGLPSRPDAIRCLHRPETLQAVERAHRRLALDELLGLQLWARRRRSARQALHAMGFRAGREAQARLIDALPFELTAAQARCVDEIAADLDLDRPMSRLLQGDVGSGKTAVAAAAIARCVGAGGQAAILAPTALLAEQHVAGLTRMLRPIGFELFDPADSGGAKAGPVLARLVGSMRPAEKAAVAQAAASGQIDLIVGTHAVIQEHVRFASLALVIVDEQHRFGVMQRAELPERGADDAPDSVPHLLIMTATPIPRTLALVLNADVDQSIIDELPPGRTPVKTLWLQSNERERALAYVRRRIEHGGQAYVVFALIDESESIDARAASVEFERLASEVYPDLRVGLLHGRLRPSEKDAVMDAFRAGDISVLVSTTVVEVGVDVPNATVMLIDGAERFGLAQLHQLRGRVGRGTAESVCLLVGDARGANAAERLEAMTRTNDGLVLAERDLELRGPGDYFGTLQSGHVERFRFAREARTDVIRAAGRLAADILAKDPDLVAPEHAPLAALVASFDTGVARA